LQGSVDTDHSPWSRPRSKSATSRSGHRACAPAWQQHRVHWQTRRDTEPLLADRPRQLQPRSFALAVSIPTNTALISAWLVPCALRIGPDHPGNPRSFPHKRREPPQTLSGHAGVRFIAQYEHLRHLDPRGLGGARTALYALSRAYPFSCARCDRTRVLVPEQRGSPRCMCRGRVFTQSGADQPKHAGADDVEAEHGQYHPQTPRHDGFVGYARLHHPLKV
jgi:hypothetical protein